MYIFTFSVYQKLTQYSKSTEFQLKKIKSDMFKIFFYMYITLINRSYFYDEFYSVRKLRDSLFFMIYT